MSNNITDMGNIRTEKLNSEFKKNIYEILSTKVKDPRLTEMFSVTKVACDRELTFAKVYVSVFSTDVKKTKATFDAIVSSAPFVRRALLKSMRIRAVPELVFVTDGTLGEGDKIDKILSEIKHGQNDS